MARQVRQIASTLAACLLPLIGQAEVRLSTSPHAGLQLEVRPVHGRIWAPTAQTDASVVNPGGDLLGDGYPGWAAQGERLVASWVRPASDSLVLFTAGPRDPAPVSVFSVAQAIGSPIVLAIGDRWLVAWQEAGSAPSTALAEFDPETKHLSDAARVNGLLTDAVVLGTTVDLLTQDGHGGLTIMAFTPGPFPDGPAPIPVNGRTLSLFPFPSDPAPIPINGRARGFDPGQLPDAPAPIPINGLVPLCTSITDGTALVAWQAAHRLIGWVVLDEGGVVGDAQFSAGPDGSCEAILGAAARNQ